MQSNLNTLALSRWFYFLFEKTYLLLEEPPSEIDHHQNEEKNADEVYFNQKTDGEADGIKFYGERLKPDGDALLEKGFDRSLWQK